MTGCVSQVGEQSFERRPHERRRRPAPHHAVTTVDTQCGSSQQATNLATSLVASGAVEVAIAGGVELMSRIPIVELLQEARARRPGLQELLQPLRVHLAVRGRRAHRGQVGRHPFRLRRVRPRLAAAGGPGLGRGSLRLPGRRGRRPRRRRRGQAHGHHPSRHPRRRPPRDHARGPRRAQAGGSPRRRPHRGLVLADSATARPPSS